MIGHFSDHAANERFLAWVRTAIAVMAFGFLVAKFDLFLKIAARSLPADDHPAVARVTTSMSERMRAPPCCSPDSHGRACCGSE